MIPFLRLWLRRVLIFTSAAALAWFTAFYLFPYIDARLPFLVAVLATYLLLAYVFIPAAIRIFRLFDKPNHVPTCAMTRDGWQSDPVNLAILARSEKELIRAMRRAGWYTADKQTLLNNIRTVWTVLFNKPYPTAPFSSLYLFGRKQDLGFQLPVGNSPRRRHHVRFWRVTRASVLGTTLEHQHHGFWRRLFDTLWPRQQSLWVGACIYDSGPIAIRWRNGQITHKTHPDADFEREFIIASLQQASVVRKVTDVKSGEPYRQLGQSLGEPVVSDGYVRLCELKR